MTRFFLIAFLTIFSQLAFAQAKFRTAATCLPGMLTPENPSDKLVLEKAFIHFKGFKYEKSDQGRYTALARFSVHYSIYNQSKQGQTINAIVPTQAFFYDFDREERSLMLDQLSASIPGLFNLNGEDQQIRSRMEALFENKVFIRRFMNVRDLPKLGMNYAIIQDGKELQYERVEVDFRWLKERPEDEGTLEADFRQKLSLYFPPSSGSELEWEFLVPAFLTGDETIKLFTPVATDGLSQWQGKIDDLFLAGKVNESSIALPYYMEYTEEAGNEGLTIIHVKDHQPQRNERLAFYDVQNIHCGCYREDEPAVPVYIPSPIVEISASSWFQNEIKLNKTCPESEEAISVFTNILPFVKGLDGTLGFTGRALKKVNHTLQILESHFTIDCDESGEPYTLLKDGYHPVWAFDEGPDSIIINKREVINQLKGSTAWCAAGGVGEYLEFTSTQAISEIKFYTGIRSSDENYRKFGRVKMMELQEVNGPYRKLIVLSDILTSSYKVEMPPGKYRMMIKEIYPGQRYESACISSIRFQFVLSDPWLNQILNRSKN